LDDQQAFDWIAQKHTNPGEPLNIDAFLMKELKI
jgi:hypothetical protein